MPANYSGEVILMVLECWSSCEEFYFKSISSHLSVGKIPDQLQRHQRSMISSGRAEPTTTGLSANVEPRNFLLTNGSVNTSDILIK